MAAPTVEEILEERRHRDGRRRDRYATLAALGLHVLAVTAALVAPLLTQAPPQRPRILPVRLVPMQRLGRVDAPPQRRPEPKPPERKPQPPPPEPTPQKPEPQRPEPEKPQEPPPPTEPEPAPDPGRLGSPEGDPLGSSAFGARISGVDPSFTHDSYLIRMLARIESEWRRPSVQGSVEAVLHFVIEKDGTVRDLRVVETSGHRPFDLAAVRAVQNASPLPPLPRSYRKDSLGVNLIVR